MKNNTRGWILLTVLVLILCLSVNGVNAAELDAVHPMPSSYWYVAEDNTTASPDHLPDPVFKEGAPADAQTYYSTTDALIKEVRTQMEARNTAFTLGLSSQSGYGNELNDIIEDGMYRHTGVPTQGDYIKKHISSLYWDYEGSTYDNTTSTYYYQINFSIGYRTTAAQEQQVTAAVNELLHQLNLDGYSDYSKVRAVYDYICKNIVYDYDGLEADNRIIYTTYSAIILKKTVCQGYATLFYRLMLELGVDCRYINGDANTVVTGPDAGDDEHGWNIVKVNGKWYNMDCTWDAEEYYWQNTMSHEHFLVCDANFPRHLPREEFLTQEFLSAYPKSTTNYAYTVSPDGWYEKDGKMYYGEGGFDRAGWLRLNNNWYYLGKNGAMVTGWAKDGNAWYYMNGDGIMQTGWLQLGNTWYYLKSSGEMMTGIGTIDGKQHSFDSFGAWQGEVKYSGWISEGGKWYYYQNDVKAIGWKTIGGTYYYFNSSGVMQTGWLKEGNTWYYLKSSGAMATGWTKDGNTWYYMNSNGVMQTGWVKIGNTYYYFNSSGVMQTGTVTISGKKHRFSSDGVWLGEAPVYTGWVQSGGYWYYYDANGNLTYGWLKLDGKWYGFNEYGQMLTGFATDNGNYYYFNSSGVMQTGWVKIDGYWHYFQSSGIMQFGWLNLNGKWYAFNGDGQMITGWGVDGDTYYYFNNDGTMVTGRKKIDGVWYTFGSNGALVS